MASTLSKFLVTTAALSVSSLIANFAWGVLRSRDEEETKPESTSSVLFLADDFGDEEVLALTNQLRARRGQLVNMLIHTCGGELSDVARLAHAVHTHGQVRVLVPFRALSGGTLVAVAAQEIMLWPEACLGPVDPQIFMGFSGFFSAHSLRDVIRARGQEAADIWVATHHEGQRATKDVATMLEKYRVPESARARLLNPDHTHAYPIFFDEAHEIGLKVTEPPAELASLTGKQLALLGEMT